MEQLISLISAYFLMAALLIRLLRLIDQYISNDFISTFVFIGIVLILYSILVCV